MRRRPRWSAPIFGHVIYIAIAALAVNLVVSAAGTVILRLLRVPDGTDETLPHQYTADPETAATTVLPPAAAAPAGDAPAGGDGDRDQGASPGR